MIDPEYTSADTLIERLTMKLTHKIFAINKQMFLFAKIIYAAQILFMIGFSIGLVVFVAESSSQKTLQTGKDFVAWVYDSIVLHVSRYLGFLLLLLPTFFIYSTHYYRGRLLFDNKYIPQKRKNMVQDERRHT